MKKLLTSLLAIALSSGCCTKKHCIETRYLEVTFHGFNPSEIDTIIVSGYLPGTGFTHAEVHSLTDTTEPSDSAPGSPYKLVRRNYDDNYEGHVPISGPSILPDHYEWKIFIPSVGKTYVLTDYKYRKYKCNKCFPVSPGSNINKALATCNVNGVSTDAQNIRITK